MSDELFEIAFSGQISAGANPEEVKARVGKMFNADDAKLAQLFSGKRMVIKKNVDHATASKYKTALSRAGADCEIKSMNESSVADPVDAETSSATSKSAPEASVTTEPVTATDPQSSASPVFEAVGGGEVAPPPQVDPLGISGDEIEDLAATIAPVGSELQSEIKEAEAPEIDTSGFDMAPVGSELSSKEKKDDPPPPDTSGISMAD